MPCCSTVPATTPSWAIPRPASFSGVGFSYQLSGFVGVTASNALGGTDTATFNGSGGADTFTGEAVPVPGQSVSSLLYAAGVAYAAIDFQQVHVIEPVESQRKALANLHDFIGDAEFTGSGDAATLTVGGVVINLESGFDAVAAWNWTTDVDQLQVAATDYIFATAKFAPDGTPLGTWG